MTTPGPVHRTRVRVRFPEVDSQGVVHHSIYLHYFEVGRTELLRDLGAPYAELEREGVRLMLTHCEQRFHHPARYDDILEVETRLEAVSRVRMTLTYRVLLQATGELAATGSTTLASLSEKGRPCPFHPRLRAALDRDLADA